MAVKGKIKGWKDYKDAMLDGVEGKHRDILSQVMENTHNAYATTKDEINKVVLEAAGDAAANSTGNISRYDTMFMPLIRRAIPATLAMDLVGVQPINTPQGIVRTLRERYSGDTGTGGPQQFEEAAGVKVYDKYSYMIKGESTNYNAVDTGDADPYAQTLRMESQPAQEMDLEVVTLRTEPKSRKLGATYSLETADDLEALDGLDINSEITTSVGNEILRELDRELLSKLHDLAGINRTRDFNDADGRYAGERLAAIGVAIDEISAEIALKIRRTGATWIVVSNRVYAALKNSSTGSFTPLVAGIQNPDYRTSMLVGTFGGNVNVYLDPYETSDCILAGYKGSELETGLIYSPYIALQSSGVMTDPANGDSRILLRHRYALTSFTNSEDSLNDSADYYGRLNISNLSLGFFNKNN